MIVGGPQDQHHPVHVCVCMCVCVCACKRNFEKLHDQVVQEDLSNLESNADNDNFMAHF